MKSKGLYNFVLPKNIGIRIVYLIIFILLAAQGIIARAQQTIYLGEFEDAKHYILEPTESNRLGKGIIIKLALNSSEVTTGENYFFSCDGKKISSGWGLSISMDGKFSDQLNRVSLELSNSAKEQLTYSVDIDNFQDNKIQSKEKIRLLLPGLCARAKPEKRGALLPFFSGAFNDQGINEVISLISGYATRKNEKIEAWVLSHFVAREVLKKSTGEPRVRQNGEPLYNYKIQPKKGTAKRLWSVDCKSRQAALLSYLVYDENGQLTSSGQTSPSQLSYTPAAPNSFGEALVDSMCEIY